jgi:hypothetical protein
MMREAQAYDPYIREAILRIRGAGYLVFFGAYKGSNYHRFIDRLQLPASGRLLH